MTDRDNLQFNVLRNALYHGARYRSLERTNRFFNFVIVLLGASTMASVTGNFGVGPLWTGLAVAVAGSLQLVFDFGRAARDHQVFQRYYYNLLADIEEDIEPTDTVLAGFKARMIRITGNEPPTLRAVDAKAYNTALDALEIHDPDTERLIVPKIHQALGWLFPFEGHHYQKVSEAE